MRIDVELKIKIDPDSKSPVTITSFQSGTNVMALLDNVKMGVLDSLDMLGMVPTNVKAHDVLYQEVGTVPKRKRKVSNVVDIGNVIVGDYHDDDNEET